MATATYLFNSEKGRLKSFVRIQAITLFKFGLVFLLVFPIAHIVWVQVIILDHGSYFSDLVGVANPSEENFERLRATSSVPGLRIGKPALTPVPSESANRYCTLTSYEPDSLYARLHNWNRTTSTDDAFIIWVHWYQNMLLVWSHSVEIKMSKPWQRINHFPGIDFLQKSRLPGELLRFKKKTGHGIPFIPEFYRLGIKHEKEEFVDRLQVGGGMGVPWVLKNTEVHQGTGISMLGPHSEKLRGLKQKLENMDHAIEPVLIEKYICNELTYEGHKFDIRVYMFVASIDPLIVFYHDGLLRLTFGAHNEKNFNSTLAHVTNISQNRKNSSGSAISASFSQWEELLYEHTASTPSLQHISDPLGHVRSQMKAALATSIEAVRDTAFHLEGVPQENLFSLLGADFIVDRDLNAWLIEINASPGLGIVEPNMIVCDTMLPEIMSIVIEISAKQEKGEPIFPLKNVDGLELIYTDEEVYRHDFGGKRKEGECR